jgi:hypothetical protein
MIRRLDVDKKTFVRDQLRLLLQRIISFTPPHSRAQGRQRVTTDIFHAVKPFAVDTFRSKRLAAIVEKKDYAAFAAFTQHVTNPQLAGATAAPWSPSLHQSQRVSRGRVVKWNTKVFVLGTADRRALKEYTKKKLALVGFARSGWLAALTSVGGTVAGWISNQPQLGQSRVIDDLDSDKPSITSINSTPWANRQDEGERIVSNAMESRVHAMETSLKKQLELMRDAAGLRAA